MTAVTESVQGVLLWLQDLVTGDHQKVGAGRAMRTAQTLPPVCAVCWRAEPPMLLGSCWAAHQEPGSCLAAAWQGQGRPGTWLQSAASVVSQKAQQAWWQSAAAGVAVGCPALHCCWGQLQEGWCLAPMRSWSAAARTTHDRGHHTRCLHSKSSSSAQQVLAWSHALNSGTHKSLYIAHS